MPNSISDSAAANAALISAKYIGDIYRIKFKENPGALEEPQIELYLDGKRPSLTAGFTGGSRNKVVTFVVTDGQQGEDNDYFADHCDGVTVTISKVTSYTATSGYVELAGLDTAETKLLKACLGDSNGDSTDNVEVYDWDYGDATHPHIVKLVRTVTSFNDGGYYAVLYWTGSAFRLYNPFVPPDVLYTDSYDVYTTTGVLAQTSDSSKANFAYGNRYFYTTTGMQDTNNDDSANWSGDLACETVSSDVSSNANLFYCLNNSDIFTILSNNELNANSPYINLYTAKRVWTTPYKYIMSERSGETGNRELKRGTHTIETDISLNWGGDDTNSDFWVYKFMPATASTYEYVAPCSNRGSCNTDTGICQCFPGYTTDSCAVQNSLAL